MGTDELRDDAPVAETLHGWDPLDTVGRREAGIRVDIDFDQGDGSGPALDLTLENGGERVAGSAPGRPEVRDDRDLP